MSSAKKYQVFISSTYTDLLDERQAAVEAILQAGHIPAGMELFTSSNQSQWDIIKRWIDESDIYMLILGGRYGSIEAKSGKSYTHLEYEYALSVKKPLFVIVIKDEALNQKTVAQVENQNPEKLKKFKKKVLSSMCEFFIDIKDIQLAVHKCLGKIIQDNELIGWVRGNQQNEGLASELVRLNEENRKLRQENEEFKRNQQIRLPKLKLTINDSDLLKIEYRSIKNKIRSKFEPIKWSDLGKLQSVIDEKEIISYNNAIMNLNEDVINKYLELYDHYYNLINDYENLTITLSNVGELKAKNVRITIKVPDFIYISDKDNSDLKELQETISSKISEIEEQLPQNPIVEYQEKLKSQNPFNHYSSGLNPFINTPLIKGLTLNGEYDDLADLRTLIIKKADFLHLTESIYDDYFLIPRTKGEGVITVKLHCEEYLKQDIIEIPIIVE
ncbi:DUF4062 domain-containing protein [Acinetobacter lanii]|uniref:DUF4062 domain-containing protein n=2 Tax=Acinetobacter lanii TaxID=2715163 RepID=A0A6G8S8P8_9GAMM|nr:DUF4062 domain-containing protein [Acinetobacter lanii]